MSIQRIIKCAGSLTLLTLLLVGCGADGEQIELDPPEGWTSADVRWWRSDLDTTGIFRNLETLQSMEVAGNDVVYAASNATAVQNEVARQRLARAVKQTLLPLYRTEPQVVDSLFENYVTPKILEAKLSSDLGTEVDRFKKQGYRTITRLYREPRTILHLGPDIPVPYPDSLRAKRIGGQVRVQASVNEEGEPMAIEIIEGVHPVLDAIALRVTTEMRWQPAYLLRGGKARPLPSWTRFKVHFTVPKS
jgi:TonB family protein